MSESHCTNPIEGLLIRLKHTHTKSFFKIQSKDTFHSTVTITSTTTTQKYISWKPKNTLEKNTP